MNQFFVEKVYFLLYYSYKNTCNIFYMVQI